MGVIGLLSPFDLDPVNTVSCDDGHFLVTTVTLPQILSTVKFIPDHLQTWDDAYSRNHTAVIRVVHQRGTP